MRYYADTLEQIYTTLEAISEPIAVLDFFAGEFGYEVQAAQVLGYRFRKQQRGRRKIVALCWKGCSLIYENVSDIQIELTNIDDSVRGNAEHDCGKGRIDWLKEVGHESRMEGIKGVVSWFPVMHVKNKYLWRDHGIHQTMMLGWLAARFAESQYVFVPPGERLIKEPYIALFDRRDPHGGFRNTTEQQVELFYTWAQKYGLRLVVVADLWPRPLPSDVIHIKPVHRDLDLIGNIVHYSWLYATPASGAGEVAAILGCNFLPLAKWPTKGDEQLLGKMVAVRGFKHFDVLCGPVVGKAEKFLHGLKRRHEGDSF